MTMQDGSEAAPSTPALRTVEQGQTDRCEASAPSEARLVDPLQTAGRRAKTRSCDARSPDRQ